MSSWLRRARASGAALVAAVVVLCQAAAWVHTAATPHVTCLEHGESVHLATAARLVSQVPLTVVATPTDIVAHGHEHCGVVSQGQSPAPESVRALADAVLATPPMPALAAPSSALALLRLAPKTSPPRAAG